MNTTTQKTQTVVSNPGETLAPAVVPHGSFFLSENAKKEIQKLQGMRPKRFLAELVLTWATILGAISIAAFAHNVWVSAIAIFIVATRQNILGLLVHEQAHCLGFKAGWGDLFVDTFAAFPLFITVHGYSKVHLSHHNFYFSDKDPDYIRKQGKEWSLPVPKRTLIRSFLKDISGLNIKKAILCKRSAVGIKGFQRPNVSFKGLQILYYTLWALLLTVTKTWGFFLLYWVLPLGTVLQMIIRFGALCEHKYNLHEPSLEESTPIIVPTWWEKILLPNLNFTLHIYHHYFPGISFSNLPKAHAIFEREGLVRPENLFHGLGSFLKFMIQTTPSPFAL